MKMLLLTFLSFFVFSLQAQEVNVWKGGFPGSEESWEHPRNWSLGEVPDEEDHVIIPSRLSEGNFYPHISAATSPIASLEMQAGATLHIAPRGVLMIDGSLTYNYGLLNYGKLLNEGVLEIENTALNPWNCEGAGQIEQVGVFAVNGAPVGGGLAYQVLEKE